MRHVGAGGPEIDRLRDAVEIAATLAPAELGRRRFAEAAIAIAGAVGSRSAIMNRQSIASHIWHGRYVGCPP
jgi:hypothetical protein